MDVVNLVRASPKVLNQRRGSRAHLASVRHQHLRAPQQLAPIPQPLLEMSLSTFSRLLLRQAPNKPAVEAGAVKGWEVKVGVT